MTTARRRHISAGAFILVGIAIFFYTAPLHGQTSRTMNVGSRVRVLLEGSTFSLVGVIAGLRPDTLLLALPSVSAERVRPLPVLDIAELNVSGGHRRYTALGVGLGLLAGTIATASYN